MSKLLNQRGGISFPIVLAVVLGLGLGASAYLNYYQHERSSDERKLMQREITDLRYQVKKDAEAASGDSPSPSPSAVATPEPSPAASPAATPAPQVAGASSITMTVNTAATLRSAAKQQSDNVLGGTTKVAAGKIVTVTGAAMNGYTPVSVDGAAGYILTSALSK